MPRCSGTRLLGTALVVIGTAVMVITATSHRPADAATGNLSIDPPTQQVNPDGTFTVTVKHNADVPITGVIFALEFDPTLVQILTPSPCQPPAAPACSITRGDAWLTAGASFYLGIAPQTKAQAIDDAT